MTIHLDSEIVATRFDQLSQSCAYTIERDGRRWTAAIPLAEFAKLGTNKIAKQNLLATALNNAMQGKPDA